MQKRNKHELEGLIHLKNITMTEDMSYQAGRIIPEVKEAREGLAHTGWLSKKMTNVHNSEVLEFI